MYANVAYLHNSMTPIKDERSPLVVTSCGYYRVDSGPIIRTNRPNGRKDYQLLYIAEGKAKFRFRGAVRIVKRGEMVLFRPYEPQLYTYFPEDKCRVYWVHFTGGEVENVLERYGLPKCGNVFFSGTSPDYQWLFEQMIRELQLCRENYSELLTILLRHNFLLIDRYLKEGNRAGANALNEIERATHYFNENYAENIRIEEYAKSLHISPCWFIRRFKEIVKVTAMQYILSLRMGNAKTLLETKNYNVAETANAVGYDDPLYFSRLFKKYVGVSPSEYKRSAYGVQTP